MKKSKISYRQVKTAVHKALRHWDLPTREGTGFFLSLKIMEKFGFTASLPVVDSRITINTMLAFYINQLARLQPQTADLLVWRFGHKRAMRTIARKLNISLDHGNRLQRQAISYLAYIIFDAEVLARTLTTKMKK